MSSLLLEKRLNVLQWVVVALLVVVIVVPFAWTWWLTRQLPVVSTVTIDNVQLLGSSALCPGDAITYQYAFHAQGSGVLIRDRVLWRLDPPPKTMVFSVSRRFILSEPIEQELVESWHVPVRYLNPETDVEEPLPPGNYRLIFAISSPSRSTVVAIAAVEFNVKEDCS